MNSLKEAIANALWKNEVELGRVIGHGCRARISGENDASHFILGLIKAGYSLNENKTKGEK